uniref:Uncharacterized protein n=1 Tax=Moniliophthora roreri TaxID=221103 RepID=A0A0W0FCQ4_MONRR
MCRIEDVDVSNITTAGISSGEASKAMQSLQEKATGLFYDNLISSAINFKTPATLSSSFHEVPFPPPTQCAALSLPFNAMLTIIG